MQPYIYIEDNQTENILPLFLATSSSAFVNSGTVIMPQLETKSVSAYPASYIPSERRLRVVNYSLPQISHSYNFPDVIVSGASVSTFYAYQQKDEIVNSRIESNNQKIIKLFNILGRDLFSKLNYVQLLFMVNTAGAVDLGTSVDIQRMYGYINQK